VIGVRTLRRVRASSGRTSSTWWLKKALLTAVIIGSLGCFTVASTFAVLSSETANGKGSLASGTLTFGNKVGSASTCFSYGGAAAPGNVNTGCTALFTSATELYPGVPTEASVQIVNNGSLDSTSLSLYMPSCTAGNTPGAPSPGADDPCASGGMQLYVQETDSGGAATQCWYPLTAPGACSFFGDTLALFVGNFSTVTTALSLGSGPAHGVTRYFKIVAELPSDASNTLQGRSATFDLTWHITN
jgi:hypothetical protein